MALAEDRCLLEGMEILSYSFRKERSSANAIGSGTVLGQSLNAPQTILEQLPEVQETVLETVLGVC